MIGGRGLLVKHSDLCEEKRGASVSLPQKDQVKAFFSIIFFFFWFLIHHRLEGDLKLTNIQ